MTARLEILVANSRSFAAGSGIASSVVNSYRLLFVRSGVLHYTLEGWTEKVGRSSLMLVPAWMKRGWRAGARGTVNLSWVEFNPSSEPAIPSQPFCWRSGDPSRETAAFSELLSTWEKKPLDSGVNLLLEGVLKSLLGRLAAGCSSSAPAADSQQEKHSPATTREIASVSGWIERHYARHDVLDAAMRLVRSSDHYFRTRFREKTGFTLAQYTLMVRMRRARYLLSSSATPIKDIAWQVGFRDPLHFSRCYRKFWKVAPRADRK